MPKDMMIHLDREPPSRRGSLWLALALAALLLAVLAAGYPCRGGSGHPEDGAGQARGGTLASRGHDPTFPAPPPFLGAFPFASGGGSLRGTLP